MTRFRIRGPIAWDTEGTGLSPHGKWKTVCYNFGNAKKPDLAIRRVVPARPFAFAFCNTQNQTLYVRGEVDPFTRTVAFTKSQQQQITDILADERIPKIAHNGRYDIGVSEAQGFVFRGEAIDTMILGHTYTGGSELTYALKPLTKKYLDYGDDDEKILVKATHKARLLAKKMRWSYANEKLGGREPAKADYWLAPYEMCEDYATRDAVRAMLLYLMWWPQVSDDQKRKIICEREHKLFWTLKRMEDRGARVHPKDVQRLKKFYQAYSDKQIAVAVKNGGAGMNYSSTPQMSAKFYDDRGHEPVFTDAGNYSLNGEMLLKLATGYTLDADVDERKLKKLRTLFGRSLVFDPKSEAWLIPADPLAKSVLEYKAAQQTISSFLEVYERCWVKEAADTYILHPSYRQNGTKTGRLSCSDPNLMQVASETTGRRKADIQSRPREAFGPRPGYVWYLPDYSQIEVWLFAHMSGEARMMAQLLSGMDYHGGIAKQVFGHLADFAEHADYYRKCAKLIMFAKLYGGGIDKLASLLKMARSLAAEFISQYEASLPGVRAFMDEMIDRAKVDGEIENPFGRRYILDHGFEYRATNYMIQGTAADVMKNAMINVDDMLRREWNDEAYLLLTIHDELVIEVPYALHSRRLMYAIVRAMQRDTQTLGMPCHLPVDMKFVTRRWSWTTKVDLPKDVRGGVLLKAA
jgi:DNA polymerase I-like protein with 3'-5' exonuclease and polymerase domains